MQVARRFLIDGEVQGVGYRFFALRAAARHQMLGTVRNLPDGRVEVVAEGERAAMDEFKMELATGPRLAVVSSLDETDIAVTGLLIRALWLGQEQDDSGWLHSSAVKQQMRRMDPSFNEKALGFRSFSDFLKSRSDVAELEETGHERLVRLRDQTP